MARSPEPIVPAPSGKYTGMPDYIAHAIRVGGGSARSLGQKIGLATGSRVSDWRSGLGVPGALSCLRLARVTGDDPVDILIMGGHADFVEVLKDVWARPQTTPEVVELAKFDTQLQIDQIIHALERAKEAVLR